jgi:glycosyltransferase involved in cell wall biosynthesis
MNLGFASPISLQLLRHLVDDGDSLPPGYQFAPSSDWVQELMKRGHHVFLYTTSREVDAPTTFRGEGLTIRIAKQRSRGTGRDLFAIERKQLKEMMSEDGCEVIHAHWTYQFALAALASRIPTLITIHDLPWNVLIHFKDLHRAARLLMAYQVAMRGEHFTAVSNDAASHFKRYLNPRAKITVIPNGLPDSMFQMGAQRKAQPNSDITFASVLQGWTRLKNAKAALEAFGTVRKAVPDAQFQMIGVDYEQGGPAHQWAIRNGLDAGVTFVGPLKYQQLLARIAASVDVIVHPSLNEAFSMTALEALALKKVFIAGKETSGMQEMLDAGNSGMLVDVTNPAAIAEAMASVARDRTFREQVAQRGFDRASSLYRLSAVISRYEAQYSGILKNANAETVLSGLYT